VDWLKAKQANRQRKQEQLELLLLRIHVHGVSVVYEPANEIFVRWLSKNWWHGFRQVKAAMSEAEARLRAYPAAHKPGCACWQCVLELNAVAAEHNARLKVQAGYQPEAAE
jgi:hypothetical protein